MCNFQLNFGINLITERSNSTLEGGVQTLLCGLLGESAISKVHKAISDL